MLLQKLHQLFETETQQLRNPVSSKILLFSKINVLSQSIMLRVCLGSEVCDSKLMLNNMAAVKGNFKVNLSVGLTSFAGTCDG